MEPSTPQRPLPGGFIATPAPPPTIFAANAASLRQHPQQPPAESSVSTVAGHPRASDLERAAKTINDTFLAESRFPQLEDYITQGTSGEYELPTNPAWTPFQKVKQHDLPARILEQANMAGLNMKIGVFATLRHAWAVLDNCLYLWDFTQPNPELFGWEENTNPIMTVKLASPKPGVFIKSIQDLIVVVTSTEMILLGVVLHSPSPGVTAVALYNTGMSISVRGLGVDIIESSETTGRIFFAGSQSDDLYEFQYQQDDGWFRGRTSCVCHTRNIVANVQGHLKDFGRWFSSAQPRNLITQLAIDDSRGLMYSLGSDSEIKVWLIRKDVQQSLSRPFANLIQSTSHFSSRTELLTGRDVSLVSLSIISVTEAQKLSLVAITNTGCRLYISVTRGFGYPADAQNPPASMQVLHVRYPPRSPGAPARATQASNSLAMVSTSSSGSTVDDKSRILTPTMSAYRFPPGYFMGFLGSSVPDTTRVFCAAPDFGRLKNPESSQTSNTRFMEYASILKLPGDVSQVVRISAGNSTASDSPMGFANELAIQFDKPSTIIAIVTNTAIHSVRRKRLVDVFAALTKYSSSNDEGYEGDMKAFIRQYGRAELAATALAVACGQAKDFTTDSPVANITDTEIVERATMTFINYGGHPEYNPNALADGNAPPSEAVKPSPRLDGVALFISRIVRSIWRSNVIKLVPQAAVGEEIQPGVSIKKLKIAQHAMNALSVFLVHVKSSIKELSETAALGGVRSRKDEIEMRGEQNAFNGLVKLVAGIIEGIAFVLVLFDEDVRQILAALGEDSKVRATSLSFEALFVSDSGRELAKELVKAIVNRNIANGSNVDTVAEALRRRCGSFCSPDDVVIFKAQEQVKRASEAGSQSESGRVLLNESQRLFQKVASSLSMEHLHWAVDQYLQMAFYAGAIQLCLTAAAQKDTGRQALAWLRDGSPESDGRKLAFDDRKRCYDLVFSAIKALDEQNAEESRSPNGYQTLAITRRNEAYDVVNTSDDAVFQTCLYDWYISIGQAERLLEINTQYVVDYLKRRSQEDRAHADLLWRYHAHHHDYLQAASVQLDLARGFFVLSLEERIEYLSRARTNASTRQTALMDSRQSKQQLLREISDLLDVANIQDDILQRMKTEPRLTGDRRSQVLGDLDGSILGLDVLFNQYADQASYHDICILIYHVADHRNLDDIRSTWQNLINSMDDEAQAFYGPQALPWETVGSKIRELGRRLNVADATFPIHFLVPMLEQYMMRQPNASAKKPPATWVLDLFIDLDVPHETLLPIMEQMLYGREAPFDTPNKAKVLIGQMVYLLRSWLQESERRGNRVVFGSEENASIVMECLSSLLKNDMESDVRLDAQQLAGLVARAAR